MCSREDCVEPISHGFSLTYAAYFVKQRLVLESMPVEWQRRFMKLMEELDDTLDLEGVPDDFWIRAKDGNQFIDDPFRHYRHAPRLPMKQREGGDQ